MKRMVVAASFLLLSLTALQPSAARTQGGQAGQASEAIESGADTYAFHCAACHGPRGLGDGPVARALSHRPSDLTTMARRRGGRFPRKDVSDFVLGRGRPIAAHGTHEMPVWGPLFRELNPFDSRVDVRLTRLLNFLESIQVK